MVKILTDIIELKDGETALFAISTRDETLSREVRRINRQYKLWNVQIPFRDFQEELIRVFKENPLLRMDDFDPKNPDDMRYLRLHCEDTVYQAQSNMVHRVH